MGVTVRLGRIAISDVTELKAQLRRTFNLDMYEVADDDKISQCFLGDESIHTDDEGFPSEEFCEIEFPGRRTICFTVHSRLAERERWRRTRASIINFLNKI